MARAGPPRAHAGRRARPGGPARARARRARGQDLALRRSAPFPAGGPLGSCGTAAPGARARVARCAPRSPRPAQPGCVRGVRSAGIRPAADPLAAARLGSDARLAVPLRPLRGPMIRCADVLDWSSPRSSGWSQRPGPLGPAVAALRPRAAAMLHVLRHYLPARKALLLFSETALLSAVVAVG